MKPKSIFILLVLLILIFSKWVNAQADTNIQQLEKDYLERIKKDSIEGNYIPKDLNECLNQLNIILNDSVKRKIKKMSEDEFTASAHFTLGLWIRNNWNLWGGSRLSKYFNDLGIFHPDDMSSIILVSYYRKLKKKDILLEEQIKNCKDFYKFKH